MMTTERAGAYCYREGYRDGLAERGEGYPCDPFAGGATVARLVRELLRAGVMSASDIRSNYANGYRAGWAHDPSNGIKPGAVVRWEVCRDCFDVFAYLAGATDAPDSTDHATELLGRFGLCAVGLSDDEPHFGRGGTCDTCDTGLAGDRFGVYIENR